MIDPMTKNKETDKFTEELSLKLLQESLSRLLLIQITHFYSRQGITLQSPERFFSDIICISIVA